MRKSIACIEQVPLPQEHLDRIEALVARIGYPLEPEKMFTRALEGALELTGGDAGSLALLDGEIGLLNLPVSKGFSEQTIRNLQLTVGQGIIGWVVEHNVPYIVPDTHKEPKYIAGDIDVRSEMAVPLRLGNSVIGALDVNAMRRDAFTAVDASTLLEFATRVAPRIENARLFGETRHRAQELAALFEIGKLVSQTLDLDRLLERIVERAVMIMDARIAALTLLDETGEWLVTSAVAGAGRDYSEKPPLPVRESLIGEVVRQKLPLIVEDVQRDPRYRFSDIARREGLRSLLAVPMMFRDRVLGVLSIYKGHLHVFKREETSLTMSLADQAAIAIRNARLYERMSGLEQQVRRLEKLGTAGEVAVGLTHELRNPLTVVKMLLDSVTELTPEDRDVIQTEVKRMAVIVEQYLNYAKPHDANWGSVSVHDVITRCLRLMEYRIVRQEIEVATDFATDVPNLIGNEEQLEQVFVNLFLNALDAMQRGGVLEVHTELAGNAARVFVSDTGEGIPKAVRERLFEPFNTSKETGMGLGLSIVRRIIRDHQGQISVESGQGKGTCFILQFPLPESSPSSDARAENGILEKDVVGNLTGK